MMNMRELAASISGNPICPDRGGYTLTMRECSNAAETLHALSRHDKLENGLHIGWGSFRNLDIVATRYSSAVLISDINIHQLRVWQAVESVIQTVDDPKSFVRKLPCQLPSHPPLRQFSSSTQHWLAGALEDPNSWLYINEPRRFDHVKQLFNMSQVGFSCLDLRAESGLQGQASGFLKLADALYKYRHEGNLSVDTIYLSNIPYMLAQAHGFYGETHEEINASCSRCPLTVMWNNLRLIAQPDTWLIMADTVSISSTADNLQWVTRLLPFPLLRPEAQ